MLSSRLVRHGLRAALLLVAAALAQPVNAQGKLEARYTASLAGIPIGKGAWVIDISDDQYMAAASGMTTGLLRLFASGQGTGAARGMIANGQPVAGSYAATTVTDQKKDEVRMVLAAGNVKDFVVDPPVTPSPERVPVTDAHRRSVTDPMTASLYRVPGNADPISPDACQRNIAVFDGRVRFDLRLAFKRLERVKADNGYQGPVAVCAVYFVPVAGFIPDRSAIRYLVAQRDMEVWLAPVAGTRVVVPFRIVIPTPFGQGVLQATQFVSAAQAGRAASAKTQ